MRVPVIGSLFGMLARGLRAVDDERNARRLARREQCSLADARRLYRLARERGYGAAHDEVFEGHQPHR